MMLAGLASEGFNQSDRRPLGRRRAGLKPSVSLVLGDTVGGMPLSRCGWRLGSVACPLNRAAIMACPLERNGATARRQRKVHRGEATAVLRRGPRQRPRGAGGERREPWPNREGTRHPASDAWRVGEGNQSSRSSRELGAQKKSARGRHRRCRMEAGRGDARQDRHRGTEPACGLPGDRGREDEAVARTDDE